MSVDAQSALHKIAAVGKFVSYFLVALGILCLYLIYLALGAAFYIVIFGGGVFVGFETGIWLHSVGIAIGLDWLAGLLLAFLLYYCEGVVNHYTDFIEKSYKWLDDHFR